MKTIFFAMLMLFACDVHAQNDLPIQYIDNRDTTKPLIVYISGDGGMNSFTNALIKSLTKKGYALLALDSKAYFWKKKEPGEFASDMNTIVTKFLKQKKRNSFIILGYSFGADVTPFWVTRLPVTLAPKCKNVIMLSASANTEFEVKITDMFGFGRKKAKMLLMN